MQRHNDPNRVEGLKSNEDLEKQDTIIMAQELKLQYEAVDLREIEK